MFYDALVQLLTKRPNYRTLGEREAAHRAQLEAARNSATAAQDKAAAEVRTMKESVAGLDTEIEKMKSKKTKDLGE